MLNEQVAEWLKQKGLKPEDLASMSNVSFSTVSNGLRGMRWGANTEEKIREAMKRHEQANSGSGSSQKAS
jgi:transcriptional regulator with XRE-family HTH domain